MRRFIRYLVIVALWTSVLILATFGSMMVILASSFLPNQIIVLISAGVFFVAYTWFCYNFTMRISFKKQLQVMILSVTVWASYVGYIEYHRSIPQMKGEVDLYYYRPFEEAAYENRLATLDEPSKFKVSGIIPRIDGATGLYPLYAAIAQATYPKMDYYPYYEPDNEKSLVRCSKTPKAYENLISGKVDVIFVAGPSNKQLAMAKTEGVELKLTPIGKEAFVFFVNSKNKVNNLSVEQIKQIYSGKITNWSDVGGGNDSIRAFQRPENSGSQTALQRIMGDTPLMKALREDVPASMGGIINQVADYRNYSNSLGYSFLFFATKMVNNKEIKLLSIDGIEANHDNIRSGKYPFAKEFYAVTRNNETRETRELIEWIRSEQGKELIRKSGFVPVE